IRLAVQCPGEDDRSADIPEHWPRRPCSRRRSRHAVATEGVAERLPRVRPSHDELVLVWVLGHAARRASICALCEVEEIPLQSRQALGLGSKGFVDADHWPERLLVKVDVCPRACRSLRIDQIADL